MTNFAKKKLQKGISLIEALVSTAIVAIGFLAVFQLVNYSVNSIDVSAERTKINYITSMVAEDMIGSRDQTANTNPSSKQCSINDYGKPVALDGSDCPDNIRKFAEDVRQNPLEYGTCSGKGGPIFNKETMTSIYKNASAEGAPENKKNRWEVILGEDRYLKCRKDPSGETDGDTKSVKVFKICTGDGCMAGSPATVFDEIYMGRVEINTNGGNKRRALYFQADYIFKE
tara:strand:- start:224 stop:910 length:687 start_codon:yes stop_codon:yes gene_type:complete